MDSAPHLVKLGQQRTEPRELWVQVLSLRDCVALLSAVEWSSL